MYKIKKLVFCVFEECVITFSYSSQSHVSELQQQSGKVTKRERKKTRDGVERERGGEREVEMRDYLLYN